MKHTGAAAVSQKQQHVPVMLQNRGEPDPTALTTFFFNYLSMYRNVLKFKGVGTLMYIIAHLLKDTRLTICHYGIELSCC